MTRTFHQSRTRLALWAPVALVLALLVGRYGWALPFPSFIALVCLLFAAFFLAAAIYLVVRLSDPAPVVRIDDDGITVYPLLSPAVFVAWDDVEWAKYPMRGVRGRGKLGIGIRPGAMPEAANKGLSGLLVPARDHVVIGQVLLGGQLAEIARDVDAQLMARAGDGAAR